MTHEEIIPTELSQIRPTPFRRTTTNKWSSL